MSWACVEHLDKKTPGVQVNVPGKCGFSRACGMYTHDLFQPFTHQNIFVDTADAPEIPHFSWDIYLNIRVVFLGFPHIPHTHTTFLSVCGIFIQDIYPPDYLCTSLRCSENSVFFLGHLPRYQGCFYRVFHASLGHVLSFTC